MSRYLITGGAGMIGSNLVKELTKQKQEVIVVDNLWRGKLEYLKKTNGEYCLDLDKQFFNRDLSRPNQIDDLIKDVDYVIHLADIVAGISYVFKNQLEIFRKNILINSNTIHSVSKSKIKGFLYIGTACSFPETLQNTYDSKLLKEGDLYPALPESAYGWSKLMGNYETDLLSKDLSFNVAHLILHNVYGSPCDFGIERSQVIPSLIRKAINYPSEQFIVWGSGKQGRAFLHVDDVIDGIIKSLSYGWNKGVIQLGPSICTPIDLIAKEIVSISKKDIKIIFDTSKPEGDSSRAADFTKAKTILGWEPRININQGLKQLYRWVKDESEKSI
ncbi:MAG: epimerase [Candidatus Marinimicrobia bacterium]|nr:epimerase [Candidatus Neomarinimicrobiota bacterium]|tara:strand:+ start:2397 stop:3389 length:993 start_codon:yes stop_codon:yes gene_type:complete